MCACNLRFAATGTIEVEEPTGGLRYGWLACPGGIKAEAALAEGWRAVRTAFFHASPWFIA
jgi:hypothetical protein